jgi:hypothetical protein
MEIKEWQKGPDSELNSLQRIILHEEWLKQIHKEIKDEIKSNEPEITKTPIIGFLD